MWYVYVLLCENGSFYTGYSPDPQKRFIEHATGKGGKYTRSFKPTKIIYTEEFLSKSGALKREATIKGWSRERKIHELHLIG